MSPEIDDNSYVVVKKNKKSNWFPKNNSILIFYHPSFGMLVKRLVDADNKGNYWFCGISDYSLSREEIGPIKKKNIYGNVMLVISKNKFRFQL